MFLPKICAHVRFDFERFKKKYLSHFNPGADKKRAIILEYRPAYFDILHSGVHAFEFYHFCSSLRARNKMEIFGFVTVKQRCIMAKLVIVTRSAV